MTKLIGRTLLICTLVFGVCLIGLVHWANEPSNGWIAKRTQSPPKQGRASQEVGRHSSKSGRRAIPPTAERIKSIESKILSQEVEVANKRELVHTLVKAIGTPYSGGFDATREAHVNWDALMQVLEQEEDEEDIGVQIESLLRLQDEKLLEYTAGLNRPDSEVPGLWEEHQLAKRAVGAIHSAGTGPEDPELVAAKAKLAELEGELKDSMSVLKAILQTQLNLINIQRGRERKVIWARGMDAEDLAGESLSYIQAQEDYERARGYQNELRIRYARLQSHSQNPPRR